MNKIKIELNNTYGKIITKIDKSLQAMLSMECSFLLNDSDFKVKSLARRHIKWDGRKRLFDCRGNKFPIGLANRVINLIGENNTTIIDNRWKVPGNDVIVFNNILRDYQENAVVESSKNNCGVIQAATGSGKTFIAAATLCRYNNFLSNMHAVFIVHTKDLLYQAKSVFEKFIGRDIGQIGDGIFNIDHNIVVATVQSLSKLCGIKYTNNSDDEDIINDTAKYKNINSDEIQRWIDSIDIVMFDEVQRAASQTAYDARFLFTNAGYAFGYSASPWRDDGADLMIEAAFGPIIYKISASELINRGYLVKPNIIIKNAPRIYCNKSDYNSVYNTVIVNNFARNNEICMCAKDYYNSGKYVLILVSRIEHGEILKNILLDIGDKNVVFLSGKDSSKTRTNSIEDMRSGNLNGSIMIASTIADVGLDIPRLDVIIECGAGKSSTTALQRLGRIMRPYKDKNECTFVTFNDRVPYIKNHIRSKIDIWRTEPEFNIIFEGDL